MARRRKKPDEEDVRHAAWAVPYGDLVTLLFAFFVVLYAVSSVNEGKYRALSSTLFTEFNGQKPPGSAPGSAPGSLLPRPTGTLATRSSAPDSHAIFEDTATVTRKQAAEIARSQAESQALDKVAADVSTAMSDLIKSNQVIVRRNGTTVEVEIRTDILFPSGSATLSPTAAGVIRKLAFSLTSLPNPVRVEGHTDSQPIDTAAFPSNWELSAARAASVVHLIANYGIDPARLSVIGRAQYSPTQSNATIAGRNANRRVLIAILPPGTLDAATDTGTAVRQDSSTSENAPLTPSDAATTTAPAPLPTAAITGPAPH